ncbi:hypothetical protein [Nostoc favosum]|uniref:Uncharacterized protein n=1 Tax=Nostoc favosum CHAB5714 TaxID=2780399 RepID=A0ABS8ICD6_9NOSO|nr:hypothetical protein [Nostoc favosum]MCC5601872.1 hypothetical protein [Nostoc favosum CHAB5714]
MTTTKIYSLICINNSILVVFYTQAHCWQFRIINDDGAVFGEQKLYYTPLAALTAGRDWICFGG